MTIRGREKGMALLLVLVVVALLTSLLTELAFSTLIDLRLTETFRDTTRAYYLARGGVTAGRMLLRQDQNDYDANDELWSQGIDNYPVGDGAVSIAIEDLDGRLAVNELVNGNNPQTLMVDRFYRLYLALEIDHLGDPAELTAALIDWLDSGDEPYQVIRTGGEEIPVAGAEDPYYRSVQEPYRCKNGPLETLDELLLVKGYSPELLKILTPHLTVNGRMQININTATEKVLMSLDPLVDAQVAEILLARRGEDPIKAVAELEDALAADVYSALKSLANQQRLGTTSEFYRIRTLARINDGTRRLMADVNKENNALLFLKVD